MYLWVRRIHLTSSLGLLLFVLMYFVTGFMMIHEEWFKSSAAAPSVHNVPLNYSGGSDDGLSQYLQDTFDLRGKRYPVRVREDGSKVFTFARPGTIFAAVVPPQGKQVTITEKHSGPVELAHALHRLHGYGGGWLYSCWAFIYDLASAALIVFAVTGIYLWYRLSSNRLPGLICLGVSFGFSAAIFAYLMLSK